MHAQEKPAGLRLQAVAELPAAESPAGENPAVLNMEVFSFLQEMLDAGILAQIYLEFLERTRERIRDLVSLDPEGVREFAHTAAGTAGMLGATALAAYAGAAGGMEPGSPALRQLARSLEAECERLETELRGRRIAL